MLVGGVTISPLVLVGGALAGAAIGAAIAYGWSRKRGVEPSTSTLLDAALFGGVIGMAGFAYAPALLGGSVVVMPATTASASGAVAATTVTSVLVAERDARKALERAEERGW